MASKRKAAPSALQPKLKALRTEEEALDSGSSVVATWIENFNLSDARSPKLWSPKTPGEKPHILTLPAEIRNQIFLDAIQQDEPIIPQATKYAGESIVSTCKQLRAEYLTDYYALNVFQINRGTRLLAWIRAVGAENFKHIKQYRVITTGPASRWNLSTRQELTVDISLEEQNPEPDSKKNIRLDYSVPVGGFGHRWGNKCPVTTFQETLSDRSGDFGYVELLRTARFFCYKNSPTSMHGAQKTWYLAPGDGPRGAEGNLDEFIAEHVARQVEREKANKKAKAKRNKFG